MYVRTTYFKVVLCTDLVMVKISIWYVRNDLVLVPKKDFGPRGHF